MNDLVAAMGINSPGIYAAFRSKKALFAEAVQHYNAAHAEGWLQASKDAPDTASGLQAMLEEAVQLFTRQDAAAPVLLPIPLPATPQTDLQESGC